MHICRQCTHCVALNCSVLQCVAVSFSVLQRVALCLSNRESSAQLAPPQLTHTRLQAMHQGCCSMLQCVAVCLSRQQTPTCAFASRAPRQNKPNFTKRAHRYKSRDNTPSVLHVLKCVAECCSVLQCVPVCGSVLQCVAVSCSVLQCAAVSCSVLQCVSVENKPYGYESGGSAQSQKTPTYLKRAR